jgi:hypothetical protein
MKNVFKLPVLPDLSIIDFSGAEDVRSLVWERRRLMFGAHGDHYIDEYMETIESLFAGHFPEYQAMDTAYHDINHTMQATLCLSTLLHNRHRAEAAPRIAAEDFDRTLVAVLFHDIGYLKARGDADGTGAKYTHVHEQRSCDLARDFLARRGWSENDIVFVQNLISATGPRADLTKIDFRSAIERAMGQAVCTADYVGQMSDPAYPDKLKVLFREFEESFRYQGMPRGEWPFASYEDLLRDTPGFWKDFVHYKMNVECAGIWQYLECPVSGENPYLSAIERNLAAIGRRIEQLDSPASRGGGSDVSVSV